MRRLAIAGVFLVAVAGTAMARGMHGGGHAGGMRGGGMRGAAGAGSRAFHGGRGGWHGGQGGWHGGGWHHHGHGGSDVFFGFGFPLYYDPFYYSYYPAYPAYGPPPYDWDYPPPPDVESGGEAPPEAGGGGGQPTQAEEPPASYGLVQLRGIPDGAAVDLDGRFWLTAKGLDGRWMALPAGSHTIAVRVDDESPVERTVDVASGRSAIVRFSGVPRAIR